MAPTSSANVGQMIDAWRSSTSPDEATTETFERMNAKVWKFSLTPIQPQGGKMSATAQVKNVPTMIIFSIAMPWLPILSANE